MEFYKIKGKAWIERSKCGTIHHSNETYFYEDLTQAKDAAEEEGITESHLITLTDKDVDGYVVIEQYDCFGDHTRVLGIYQTYEEALARLKYDYENDNRAQVESNGCWYHYYKLLPFKYGEAIDGDSWDTIVPKHEEEEEEEEDEDEE